MVLFLPSGKVIGMFSFLFIPFIMHFYLEDKCTSIYTKGIKRFWVAGKFTVYFIVLNIIFRSCLVVFIDYYSFIFFIEIIQV